MIKNKFCFCFLLALSVYSLTSFSEITKMYEINVMNEPFLASKDVSDDLIYLGEKTMVSSHFPFKNNEKFLDIGCGIGVASIIAAKKYNNKVVAVDIDPMAVQITAENAKKHCVQSLVNIRESDIFSNIHANEKFDTIYWDLPYVYIEALEDKNLNILQRSVSDPGYQHIERFLAQAPHYTNSGGRIIIGFGSNNNHELFTSLAHKHHYKMNKIYEDYNPYREGITYQLYVLEPVNS